MGNCLAKTKADSVYPNRPLMQKKTLHLHPNMVLKDCIKKIFTRDLRDIQLLPSKFDTGQKVLLTNAIKEAFT